MISRRNPTNGDLRPAGPNTGLAQAKARPPYESVRAPNAGLAGDISPDPPDQDQDQDQDPDPDPDHDPAHADTLPPVDREARDEAIRDALVRARAGERDALWEAVEGLRPYLRAVARSILGGRLEGKVDVADVVQQSLLAAIERFDQFRGETPGEWQQWLVTIVRNEARNLLRFWHQDRRNVAAESPVAGSMVETGKGDEGEKPRLPAPEPTPSRQVATRQEAMQLLEAIDRLPADYREVLRLRHFEGLSHKAIARRLGKTDAAVRQLWVRALALLRDAVVPSGAA